MAVAPDDREAYAAVLKRLVRPGGRVLFVSVEHPPFEGGKLGPPHSIERAEVDRLFSADFDIEVESCVEINQGVRLCERSLR